MCLVRRHPKYWIRCRIRLYLMFMVRQFLRCGIILQRGIGSRQILCSSGICLASRLSTGLSLNRLYRQSNTFAASSWLLTRTLRCSRCLASSPGAIVLRRVLLSGTLMASALRKSIRTKSTAMLHSSSRDLSRGRISLTPHHRKTLRRRSYVKLMRVRYS